LLTKAALQAEQRGWHLYLVGAVRDLLLAEKGGASTLMIQDIDLVVDSFHQSDSDVGAGVELAEHSSNLPAARLEIHGAFQTAAWHKELVPGWVLSTAGRLKLARCQAEISLSTPYRALTPLVLEAIGFLWRFTGFQAKQIRVLHANSFIDPPNLPRCTLCRAVGI